MGEGEDPPFGVEVSDEGCFGRWGEEGVSLALCGGRNLKGGDDVELGLKDELDVRGEVKVEVEVRKEGARDGVNASSRWSISIWLTWTLRNLREKRVMEKRMNLPLVMSWCHFR
jgi:hypothetical protein